MDTETSSGGQDPITRKINGNEVQFAELGFSSRVKLVRKMREADKARLTQYLDEIDADPDTRKQELAVFLNERPGETAWTELFNSDEGKLLVLKESLILSGKSEEEAQKLTDAYCGSSLDMFQLCAAITHTPLDQYVSMTKVEEIVCKRVAEELEKIKRGDDPNSGAGETRKGFGTI